MSISAARNLAPRKRAIYGRASPKVAPPQPSDDEVTLERLLANEERARWGASVAANETLRRQLLDIAHNYGEMAKMFEMVIRQRRPT
jgi:hypothetical protein